MVTESNFTQSVLDILICGFSIYIKGGQWSSPGGGSYLDKLVIIDGLKLWSRQVAFTISNHYHVSMAEELLLKMNWLLQCQMMYFILKKCLLGVMWMSGLSNTMQLMVYEVFQPDSM